MKRFKMTRVPFYIFTTATLFLTILYFIEMNDPIFKDMGYLILIWVYLDIFLFQRSFWGSGGFDENELFYIWPFPFLLKKKYTWSDADEFYIRHPFINSGPFYAVSFKNGKEFLLGAVGGDCEKLIDEILDIAKRKNPNIKISESILALKAES